MSKIPTHTNYFKENRNFGNLIVYYVKVSNTTRVLQYLNLPEIQHLEKYCFII